jgi:hypothetical protein
MNARQISNINKHLPTENGLYRPGKRSLIISLHHTRPRQELLRSMGGDGESKNRLLCNAGEFPITDPVFKKSLFFLICGIRHGSGGSRQSEKCYRISDV